MKLKIKNLKNKIFIALFVSLLIHLVLVIWSFFVKVSILGDKDEEVKPRVVKVKMIKENPESLVPDKKIQPATQKDDAPSADESPEFVSVERTEIERAQPDVFEPKREMALLNNEESGSLKLLEAQKKDTLTKSVTRRKTRDRLVENTPIPQKDLESVKPSTAQHSEMAKTYLEQSMNRISGRELDPMAPSRTSNENELMKSFDTGLKRQALVSDLGDTLVYELTTYKDPKDDQQYFKISIKVKFVAPDLPSIPKEFIIVLDASKSIGDKRLEEFKEGLIYSLNHLNPSDVFNIIVFRDETFALSKTSLTPSEEHIQQATEFLNKLQSSSKTDMYGALKSSLNLDSTFVPSYRLLLSDGFPTKGVTDSRRVINEIADINKGRICLFSFGGGVNISEYMLDFIAYKNRGRSWYTGRVHRIAKDLSAFYDEIKDPILLHPRYYTSGLKEEDLYAKDLPDFFRGAEFELYGTYTNENKFVIQLLGDLSNETRQIVIHGELKNAAEGDKSIAERWAFHRVYYLISQLKQDTKNEEILKEIDELSKKFNIVTPYSKNFRK